MISSLENKSAEKDNVIGAVLPHAGYIYSGQVAVETVSGINIKENLILIGPNHTGLGALYSIMTQGAWQTPLGEIKINEELAGLILEKSGCLENDDLAHLSEHSLEVEIPIIQYFRSDFKIVPITIMGADKNCLSRIAQAIAAAVKEKGLSESTLIIASSDMTHYETKDSALKKDNLAIEAITALNEEKLASLIGEYDISMCGFLPVTVLIESAKALGAKSAKLIKYQTSGDATGDYESVVGYAGITIK